MGGCRCSYKNCLNTTKSADNTHFFHFPIKHRQRCVTWIENACKPSFYDLEEEQLRSKVICEEHFETKWFPNSQHKRLLQGAVPTLDGESNALNAPISNRDRDMDSDTPIYLSNQYNDVKVVPANDDGTVFVLDTDNMFTISPKIESYIIKNGVIVPATSNGTTRPTQGKFTKQSTLNRFTKPSTNTSGYVMGAETEIANINASPGPSNSLLTDPPLYQLDFNNKDLFESHDATQSTHESGGHLDYEDEQPGPSHSTYSESKPNLEHGKPLGKSNLRRGPVKTIVSKSYMRQLKQHSREIANIKRMLEEKRIIEQSPKIPDRHTILSALQPQLPPTLHSILSLLLGEKNELNEDDVEFFTTLHRGSPEVYHILSEKYKWNLPSVDVDIVGTPTQ